MLASLDTKAAAVRFSQPIDNPHDVIEVCFVGFGRRSVVADHATDTQRIAVARRLL